MATVQATQPGTASADYTPHRVVAGPLSDEPAALTLVPSLVGHRGPIWTALLPPAAASRPCPIDWARVGRISSRVGYWIGALTLCMGIGSQSPLIVNAAAAVLSLAMAASDLGRHERGGITVITLHSLLCAATAVANVVGLREAHSPMRTLYFIYSVDEHLYLASLLQLAQGCVPVVGFWLMVRWRPALRALRLAPVLDSGIDPKAAIVGGAVMAALSIGMRMSPQSIFVDTFLALAYFAPSIAAFALARMGADRQHAGLTVTALVIALADAARAFFFDYLRGTIAQPLVAFTVGAVLGARSLRPVRQMHFVPVLAVGALFVVFYGLLGETRARGVHGMDRFADIHEYRDWRSKQRDIGYEQTIVARLTSFNQLSQIGGLVERNGHYDGRTFAHLRYAFVPRVLWPEKPKIALGAWFAMEIGQAVATADGWYNNSVNMTQAGELYLNFGWIGVIPGLALFGAILAFFWTRASFWELGSRNYFGSAFAAFMFWTILGGHGEFTLLISLTGIFLALYLLSLLLGSVQLVWALLTSRRAGEALRQVVTH
jgi:hypothetical protein